MTRVWKQGLVLMGVAAVAACGGGDGGGAATAAGEVQIDGSSTVFPITEAVAEEFMAETGGEVRVTVAMSGTGGGFKRFCTGETDISNASRSIKDSEVEQCRQAGIEPVEVPVAWDGLAVVVHPSNSFVQCLTLDELRRIWGPGSRVTTWADVRSEWPAEPIKLYGPGTNSGTFDYFTEEVLGEAGASRSDYTASEDDNVLVQGVSGDPGSLGYFGYAYFEENQGRIRAVGVDAGQGCVTPSAQTVEAGQYPLSRPLYLYINRASLQQKPAVRDFVSYYLETAPQLATEVGYFPLAAARYQEAQQKVEQAVSAANANATS